MSNRKNKKNKDVKTTAERIYAKRYFGIMEDFSPIWNSSLNPKWSDNTEINDFRNNFGYCLPIKENILFSPYLLDELKEVAYEKDVNLSILINCYLLQMLERDRRTEAHTKGKRSYIKNNLYTISNFISHAETLEEFSNNILNKNFIKYGEIQYKEKLIDNEKALLKHLEKNNGQVKLIHDVNERIYIINYLLNNGYSMKQIEDIEKEEEEYIKSHGYITTNLTIEGINKSYEAQITISTRLGLHYILLATTNLNDYKSIEGFLNSKLQGDKKVWDLYQDYLDQKLI